MMESKILSSRKEIKLLILKMQNGEEDIIEGLREIYNLWNDAGFPLDSNYYSISLRVDDTETIIKGNIKRNFSTEYIKELEVFEKEYLEDTLPDIIKTLDDILKASYMNKLKIAFQEENF